MSKPIKLYSHTFGPSPWKVAIVLKELELEYETQYLTQQEVKQEPYQKINPNGRIPAVEDPKTGVVLWESAAIIEYLISEYDTSNTLTYTTSPEKYQLKQWLYFQMSAQGPSFEQASWSIHFDPEQIDSAQQRTKNEIKRVLSVLNRALEGTEYLVGDKCTIADLAFVTWDAMIPWIFKNNPPDTASLYPNYHAWHQRITSRPAVQKILKEKDDLNPTTDP
ncbi:MAG: glutathione S- transferase, nitrogen catabolite repression regulator [Candelina mexicana]|nr:MAG: glutathione S- transferase, nitrogen catabolite repression regulator [Candelina mexicana]